MAAAVSDAFLVSRNLTVSQAVAHWQAEQWPTWTTDGGGRFPWARGSTQMVIVNEGMVIITPTGEWEGRRATLLQSGDMAFFPGGFQSEWDVHTRLCLLWQDTGFHADEIVPKEQPRVDDPTLESVDSPSTPRAVAEARTQTEHSATPGNSYDPWRLAGPAGARPPSPGRTGVPPLDAPQMRTLPMRIKQPPPVPSSFVSTAATISGSAAGSSAMTPQAPRLTVPTMTGGRITGVPEGWVPLSNSRGKTYSWDTVSGATTWHFPTWPAGTVRPRTG